jgi:predicted RNA-binding Zn-ribbon protein involved in translation (DUF1610 family)
MARELARAGFTIDAELAVSHFRHPLLKRLISPRRLAVLDGLIQKPGAKWKLAPSIFLRGRMAGAGPVASGVLFRCPTCGDSNLAGAESSLTCSTCGAVWTVVDGIYDFKTPQPSPDGQSFRPVTQTTVSATSVG